MPSYGATLPGALGAVDGAVDAVPPLGAGLAEPLQAAKTIATVPMRATGDHLVVRDMHSSSNGSLAGTRRMRVPGRSVRSARVRPMGRRSRVPDRLARVCGELPCTDAFARGTRAERARFTMPLVAGRAGGVAVMLRA